MKAKPFEASMFTATKWDSAEQKAKFANHFVRFVESGFKPTLFPDWFYRRLSNCFFHIAHYNKAGFYSVWFQFARSRRDFLNNALDTSVYGDPAFTYSDVERALKGWIAKSPALANASAEAAAIVERAERSELARLKAKYEQPLAEAA